MRCSASQTLSLMVVEAVRDMTLEIKGGILAGEINLGALSGSWGNTQCLLCGSMLRTLSGHCSVCFKVLSNFYKVLEFS